MVKLWVELTTTGPKVQRVFPAYIALPTGMHFKWPECAVSDQNALYVSDQTFLTRLMFKLGEFWI